MGDPVNQAQFYEAIQQLRDLIDLKHVSSRQYLTERADKLEGLMNEHAADDARQFRQVNDRVLVMETQRAEEAKQAVRRGTVAGMLAAAGITGVLEAAKAYLVK